MLLLQFLLQKVRNIKQLPVDMKAITEGLSSLLVPSQTPMFSQRMYAVKTIFGSVFPLPKSFFFLSFLNL